MTGSPATSVIVVMGVSGSGKSTIAALLARILRWQFADGDSFHPAANVAKMKNRIPLTDEDRLPWLRTIAEWIDAIRAVGGHAVIGCSALKREYRAALIGDRNDVRLVYLKGERALIAHRLAARQQHFMPLALLDSQFEALEEPGFDEQPVVVSVDASPHEIASTIIAALGLQHTPVT